MKRVCIKTLNIEKNRLSFNFFFFFKIIIISLKITRCRCCYYCCWFSVLYKIYYSFPPRYVIYIVCQTQPNKTQTKKKKKLNLFQRNQLFKKHNWWENLKLVKIIIHLSNWILVYINFFFFFVTVNYFLNNCFWFFLNQVVL